MLGSKACKTIEFYQDSNKKLVACTKKWITFCFDIYRCHMFSSYSFWANLRFKWWFSLILHCLYDAFVPRPGSKLMFSGLTTRDSKHGWWSLLHHLWLLLVKFLLLLCSFPCRINLWKVSWSSGLYVVYVRWYKDCVYISLPPNQHFTFSSHKASNQPQLR